MINIHCMGNYLAMSADPTPKSKCSRHLYANFTMSNSLYYCCCYYCYCCCCYCCCCWYCSLQPISFLLRFFGCFWCWLPVFASGLAFSKSNHTWNQSQNLLLRIILGTLRLHFDNQVFLQILTFDYSWEIVETPLDNQQLNPRYSLLLSWFWFIRIFLLLF